MIKRNTSIAKRIKTSITISLYSLNFDANDENQLIVEYNSDPG